MPQEEDKGPAYKWALWAVSSATQAIVIALFAAWAWPFLGLPTPNFWVGLIIGASSASMPLETILAIRKAAEQKI